MRKLEPLIERFVDDVLRLIREATVEELRELVIHVPAPEEDRAGQRAAAVEPAVGEPTRSAPLGAPRPRRVVSAAPPPASAEITDPEALLSIAVHPHAPERDAYPPARVVGSEGDGPESYVRPVARAPVPLAGNETVARISSAGVVIRRKKSG